MFEITKLTCTCNVLSFDFKSPLSQGGGLWVLTPSSSLAIGPNAPPTEFGGSIYHRMLVHVNPAVNSLLFFSFFCKILYLELTHVAVDMVHGTIKQPLQADGPGLDCRVAILASSLGMQLVATWLISELYTAAVDVDDVSLLKFTINRRLNYRRTRVVCACGGFNTTRQLLFAFRRTCSITACQRNELKVTFSGAAHCSLERGGSLSTVGFYYKG